MLIMLVLSLAILPTAGVAITIAQNDLSAALDDWHRYQAEEAAKATLLQIQGQLMRGEPVSPRWPDDEIEITYSVRTLTTRWEVTVQASYRRARVRKEKSIPRNP
jgi:hypothetical protein